jgi:hypothetical protein
MERLGEHFKAILTRYMAFSDLDCKICCGLGRQKEEMAAREEERKE